MHVDEYLMKLSPKLYKRMLFLKKNRYIANIRNPQTYNEKLLHRLWFSDRTDFSDYADKLKAKDLVASSIGREAVIPTLWSGGEVSDSILSDLLKANEAIYVKANHNSGPVHFLCRDSSRDEIEKAVTSVNCQLKDDYGKKKLEYWYTGIERKILVEKSLHGKSQPPPPDYKFHVFQNMDTRSFTTIVQVDYDRSEHHHRSFFDTDGNWLPFGIRVPVLRTKHTMPSCFKKMVQLAEKIAAPFSYCRVDLYEVKGTIKFGEVTFCPVGGTGAFSAYAYDKWMGDLWTHDDSRRKFKSTK